MANEKPRAELLALTWPIFVEQLLMMAIGTLCLWLAGSISTAAVAIYGLANQLRGIADRIFRVVGIGTSVVLTQHKGAGDEQGAREVARAGLAASVWMGLVAMALISVAPAQVLRLLHLPPELMTQAIPFFMLIGVGLALDAVVITMTSVLRAFKYTCDSMRLTLAMNLLHAAISVPLVTGFAGLPSLGLMGLGWAQIASRVLVLTLLVLMWLRRLQITLSLRLLWSRHAGALPAILQIGLPSAGEKIGFRIAFLMTVSMAASMGAATLATHAYALQAAGWITMYMVSLGFGSEIILGHLIGGGRLKEASRQLWRALFIALGITLAGAVLACLVTPGLIARATGNAELAGLVATIMLLELLLEPGRCLNVILLGGLRAAGDVRFPVKVSVVSNFVFGAGLAWLAGVHFSLGLAGIWLGYIADEWARGLAMALRWRSLGWTRSARATRRRILHRLARS